MTKNFMIIINSVQSLFLYMLVVAYMVIIITTPASASGIGVQLVTGGGGLLYQQSEILLSNNNTIGNTMIIGCGFVADTNLGGKKIFNYRFRIGYDFQKGENDDIKQLHRVTMTHVFGAKIYSNDSIRLWIGPHVGAGYLWGDNRYINPDYNSSYSFDNNYWKTLSFSLANFHAGMTLGININISSSLTIPLEGGFKFNIYTDFRKEDKDGIRKKLFNVIGPEGYVAVGVMYRFNETTEKAGGNDTSPKQ